MIHLRQNRWPFSLFQAGDLPWPAAALLLGAGLLVPAAVAAAPHAHARRPLPTALHSASVSENSLHSPGRHKAAAKTATRSHAAGANAPASGGTHHSAGKGKKRGRTSEPVDEPIPMYRAGRGRAPLDRRQDRDVHLAGDRRRSGFVAYGPAPRVHQIAGRRSRVPEAMPALPERTRPMLASHAVSASHGAAPSPAASSLRPSAAREEGIRDGRYVASHAAVASSDPGLRPFAEGVSHPEGDERLPVSRALAASANTPDTVAAAPVVRVSAPPSPNAPSGLQAPVVQGFGSEVAVPSNDSGERPGGTRRRNHPANWVPESLNLSAEPLEEREAVTNAAISPAVLPLLYDRNGRLVVPAPLKGSHEVLVHQNVMGASDGLMRIQDDADLDRLRAAHLLIPFPASEALHVSDDLSYNRRCARPWTVLFALDAAKAFYARFHQPLQVNSAVRTVSYQARLQMVNGNAAAIAGDAASPHLTGQAIDIGKRGMSVAELAWMRGYLLPLMRSGKIDVEEEFQQACFHISVYRSYAPVVRRPVHEIAQGTAMPAASGDDGIVQ